VKISCVLETQACCNNLSNYLGVLSGLFSLFIELHFFKNSIFVEVNLLTTSVLAILAWWQFVKFSISWHGESRTTATSW